MTTATKKLVSEDALQTAKAWMKKHICWDGQSSYGPTEGMMNNMIAGGMTGAYCSGGGETPEQALFSALTRRWLVKRMPNKVALATSVADIEKARSEGKIAIVYGWQRANLLEHDYRWLEIFYEYGLRILNFCYNEENALSFGCLNPFDHGLKRYGQVILQDCNRLGILLDCSHSGERASLDIIEQSTTPPVFTHSGAKGFWANGRNITDAQIKACAQKGGVIGLPVFADFVFDTRVRQPTLDDWVKHMDHLVNKAGIDHVGIGCDMVTAGAGVQWDNGTKRRNRDICGAMTFETHDVVGLDHSHANYSLLIAALVQRGYKEPDVAKIMGSNWMRAYKQAWGK